MGNGRGNDGIGNKLSFPPNVFRGTQKYLLVAAERCTFWDCYILTHQSTSCHLRTAAPSMSSFGLKSMQEFMAWWSMMNFALHSVPSTVRHSIQFFTWLRLLLPLYHHHTICKSLKCSRWLCGLPLLSAMRSLTASTTRVVSHPDPVPHSTEPNPSFRLQRGRMEFTEIPLRVDLHLVQ